MCSVGDIVKWLDRRACRHAHDSMPRRAGLPPGTSSMTWKPSPDAPVLDDETIGFRVDHLVSREWRTPEPVPGIASTASCRACGRAPAAMHHVVVIPLALDLDEPEGPQLGSHQISPRTIGPLTRPAYACRRSVRDARASTSMPSPSCLAAVVAALVVSLRRRSSCDAVLEVRDPGRLDRAELLELELRADAGEEARASAQEDRRDVQLQLVDQTGRQVLVDDVGAAADEDVLVAGGLPRSLQGGLDPIGDEREGRVRTGSAARARGG